MRVVPSTAPQHAGLAREVEPKRTQVSQAEIRDAIARAHSEVTGRAASGPTLEVLTAQASLETACGGRMYNYNFGGIKGSGPTGETAKLRTHEVLGGKDVEIRDGFRAYRTLDEGATDYVRLMKDRFPGAMAQAERGDVDGFAKALKQSGYYTAAEKDYASGLRSLMGAASTAGGGHAASERLTVGSLPALPNMSSISAGTAAGPGFVDTTQLSRVMDAIGHHRDTTSDDED